MHEQVDDNLDGDCQGVDGKKTEMKSDSFLFYMVQEGTTEGVLSTFRAQLESVSDVDDIRDSRRNTLLHSSVFSRNLRAVDILLRKGADALAVNLDCDTPLVLAKSAYQRSNSTQTDREIYFLIKSSLREFQGNRAVTLDTEYNSSPSMSDSDTASIQNSINALYLNGGGYDFDDIEIPDEEIGMSYHQSMDLEVEDTKSMVERLGVAYPVEDEVIYLPKNVLHHVNTYRDSKGRSLLTKFTESGNLEVLNFLLKCRGLDVNSIDENQQTATEISWSRKDYRCFLALVRNDARFPGDFRPIAIEGSKPGANDLKEFIDQRMQLHANIEAGNMEAVVEATKQRSSSLYLKIDNESALLCSSRRRDVHSLKMYAYFLFLNLSLEENEIIYPHTEEECNIINKQTKKLLESYSKQYHHYSIGYTWKFNFRHDLLKLKNLENYGDFLQKMSSKKYSLKNGFSDFRSYLNTYVNLSILVTTNVSLCLSLIYHNLMTKYAENFGYSCLFFELHVFEMNQDRIVNAYNSEECNYLILYAYGTDINLEYVSQLFSVGKILESKNRPILILSSDCQDIKCEWSSNLMNYQWIDLSSSTKKEILEKSVNFQGLEVNLGALILEFTKDNPVDDLNLPDNRFSKENLDTLVEEQHAALYFPPGVLSYLMSQEEIVIGNSTKLTQFEHSSNLYIHRNFSRQISSYLIFLSIEKPSLPLFIRLLNEIYKSKNLNYSKYVVYENVGVLRDENIIVVKILDEVVDEMLREVSNKKEEQLKVHYYNVRSGEFRSNMSRERSSIIDSFFKAKNICECEFIQFSDALDERHVTILGEPGSGKSTVLTKIISMHKERDPFTWVGRLNVVDFTSGNGKEADLDRLKNVKIFEEFLEIFMDILELRSCLERNLFRMALKINRKVRIFIDGYEDVIPFYELTLVQLVRYLIEKTDSQVWLTSRSADNLVNYNLGSYSYTLEMLPFPRHLSLVDKIWKMKFKSILSKSFHVHRLDRVFIFQKKIAGVHGEIQKNLTKKIDSEDKKQLIMLTHALERIYSLAEESKDTQDQKTKLAILRDEIDKIDFTPQAAILLQSMTIYIADIKKSFTPMILSIVAFISFQRNLRIDGIKDTYSLYEHFVKERARLYLRHREGFHMQGCNSRDITESEIFELHQILALKVMKQQQWDPTKFSKEADILLGVGIVVQTQGNLKFRHRTFTEFFVAHWIVGHAHQPTLISQDLKEVLLEFKYVTARRFLNERHEDSGGKKWLEFSDELVETLNVSEIFLESALKKTMKDCSYIWPDIIKKFEKISGLAAFTNFLHKISDCYFHEWKDISTLVLQILSRSLSDECLTMLLDTNITTLHEQCSNFKTIVTGNFKVPFIWASRCSASAFTELLYMIKRMLCFKAYKTNPYDELTVSLLGGKDIVNEKFEKQRIPYGLEETMKFLEIEDINGWTILHAALKNQEYEVFSQLLAFIEDILGKRRLGTYFAKINKHGLTLLHFCSMSSFYYFHCNRVLQILYILPQYLDNERRISLINQTDYRGFNFLHYLVWCANEEVVEETLLHLIDVLGFTGIKQLLLQRNDNGLSVLQHASNNKDIKVMFQVMKYARNLMEDNEFLDFVQQGDNKGNTIFHTRASFGRRYPDLRSIIMIKLKSIEDLRILSSFISDSVHRKLLVRENNNGETFLHLSVPGHFNQKNLLYAIKMLDADLLETFLSQRDSNGNGYLHNIASLRLCQKRMVIFYALKELKKVLPPSSFARLIEMKNAQELSALDILVRDAPELYELTMSEIYEEETPTIE